jgi:hypothetical protein
MQRHGALFGPDAFADSAFLLGGAVARALLAFFRARRDDLARVELDAYADFQRPLGALASDAYLADAAAPPLLGRLRRDLFELLRGTDYRVLLVPGAVSLHTGTVAEYVAHCAGDLPALLGGSRVCCARWGPDAPPPAASRPPPASQPRPSSSTP